MYSWPFFFGVTSSGYPATDSSKIAIVSTGPSGSAGTDMSLVSDIGFELPMMVSSGLTG